MSKVAECQGCGRTLTIHKGFCTKCKRDLGMVDDWMKQPSDRLAFRAPFLAFAEVHDVLRNMTRPPVSRVPGFWR